MAKKRARRCPECGSKKTGKYLYGLPASDDEELRAEIDRGETNRALWRCYSSI